MLYLWLCDRHFSLDCGLQSLRSLSADVRHSAGFATAAGQGTGLTARDLLYPDSFSDAYQYAMDPQGQPLGAQFLSVRPLLPSISPSIAR